MLSCIDTWVFNSDDLDASHKFGASCFSKVLSLFFIKLLLLLIPCSTLSETSLPSCPSVSKFPNGEDIAFSALFISLSKSSIRSNNAGVIESIFDSRSDIQYFFLFERSAASPVIGRVNFCKRVRQSDNCLS